VLVLAVWVAGLFFGDEAARGLVASQIQGLVGTEASDAIQSILAHARKPGEGVLGTVVGAVVLLFGASGVFGELQDSLNTIWEVKSKPGRGILGVIKDRLFSFGMVLGVAFVLLVSLVLSAGLTALGGLLEQSLPGGAAVWQVLNFVIGLAVVTGLFAAIYKVVPDVTLSYRDVLVGSFVTALLFTVGKALIGLYLGTASVGSPFGAAGSLVVVVVWVYYSASVFFFGAEFTQAWAARHARGSSRTEMRCRSPRCRPRRGRRHSRRPPSHSRQRRGWGARSRRGDPTGAAGVVVAAEAVGLERRSRIRNGLVGVVVDAGATVPK
ncbi:MAG: YihY/virulence factor BrkB family protein, partial [Polyangiaceae bacterium]